MLEPAEILESNDKRLLDEWMRRQISGSWFTGRLVRLCLTADANNLNRLMLGFPDEVGLVLWYKTGINPMRINEVRDQVEEERDAAHRN